LANNGTNFTTVLYCHYFGPRDIIGLTTGTKMDDLDLCIEVVSDHVNHRVTFAIGYLGNH